MKAIGIQKIDGKPGQVYYPYLPFILNTLICGALNSSEQLPTADFHSLNSLDLPTPIPKQNELLIKLHAAALNHRDLFIRQHFYGTAFDVPLCADGVGTVISAGSSELNRQWKGKKVILVPGRGWDSDPAGPESGNYLILGGTKYIPFGTAQEYVCIDAKEVEEAPGHLEIPEAAALPLCGLTAFRAVFTKAGVKKGDNVLITGIGGGVALAALQFCTAAGATVFVTSGDERKLEFAKELGAAAGVCYKHEGWDKKMKALLPNSRPFLDYVIDGAGGDIITKTSGLLKQGGRIVSYGMNPGTQLPFTMSAVAKNIEILGSMMGSRKEFKQMVAFVREKQIRPVISKVVRGLDVEKLEELFDDMNNGKQFGKLVVLFEDSEAKLKL
ncbi:hypothetical protein RUND412_010326 [Rhizina undulata]